MKYRSKKVELDGHVFHSQAEAKHYWHVLKPQAEAGEITNLELQPTFECKIDGRLICKYIADFVYFKDGKRVVEDVKGVKTDVYRLKKKLVEALYPGVTVSEISVRTLQSKKYSLPSPDTQD